MGLVLPPSDASHGPHLPLVQAYADKLGCVTGMNQVVPTEMAMEPGTMVLGMRLDTWRGRRPRDRLEEGFAQHETALLLGKAVTPEGCDDDTGGRVFDRLYVFTGIIGRHLHSPTMAPPRRLRAALWTARYDVV